MSSNFSGESSQLPLPPLLGHSDRSAFVGRKAEMQLLREHWAHVCEGRHQLVFLVGEPGIGKTRLATEFALAAYAEGATVLFGRTDEGAALPYQAFVEALRHCVAECPLDMLRARLTLAGAELSRLIPEIPQRLPDLPILPQGEPDSERYHLFDTFSALFAQISKDRPVILVLDDLHWADKQTPLLLKHIVRSMEKASLLIIGTYREAELSTNHPLSAALADLRRDRIMRRLTMGGLTEDEVSDLISARVGKEAPSDFIHTVYAQTEGNPFYIEEVLRHLAETGAVYQRDGLWATDLAVENMGIPESVKEVIGQRLSRLSEECNSILTMASVVGREFDLESLKRASGLLEDRLTELLDEAVAARVISEVPHSVGRYSFSHALIYETLYDELTTTRRVRLHGQTLEYADSNGVKLAFEVLGGAGPYVVAVGLSNCPAVRPRNMNIAKRWDRISRFCRVILYDRRGVGFSAVPDRGYSLLASVEDLRAILNAVGAGRIVLWGAADGGPLAIAFAVRHPERVAGLILLGTSPKLYNSDDFKLGINPVAMDSFLRNDVSDQARAVSQLTRTRYDYQNAQSIVEVLNRVPKRIWSKILGSIGSADVRELLAQIKVPTLIVHDPGNNYIPVEAAHYLHERIPNSKLEITEEYGGAMLFEESLYCRIQDFIEDVTTRSHAPWDMFNYHFMRTREALLRGDLGEASTHVDMALDLAIDAENRLPVAMCHLAKAHVMQWLGKHKEATNFLKQAFSIARQEESIQVEFHALWAEAQFSLERGDEASGLRALRKVLRIGRERGFMETLIIQPAAVARLCIKALEADIEVEYVQDFIRKRNLVPDTPPLHLESWPWTARIYALGRFQIVVDEKPLGFSRKAQQKPLSLLKALIALGSIDVKEEQLADILWPDAEGDSAHRSFATTLYRLRKLVGHHEMIQLREGCVSLDLRHCWVDVLAFEDLLTMAGDEREKEAATGEAAEAARLTQKAIDIYGGPFLAGETGDSWSISPRERLRSKYIQNVLILGRKLESVAQWENAAMCYERGLEIEDLVEEFYQRLMVCYQQLGRRSEVLSVYDRCKKTLYAAKQIQPSSEIEALRKSNLAENK